jgi:hypothetical protein
MPRLNQKRYEQRLMLAMSIYVVVLLLVLPVVRTVASIPLKGALAVAPVLPMLYVIWLMAQRIRDSDELEQRMHLIALGVATAVVAACSLVGGFLATAQVLPIDGSILIWVFPLMMFCYGATRWWIARRYGSDMSCDGAMPMHWRLSIIAAMMTVVGIFTYLRRDAIDAGIFIGMGAGLAVLALFKLATHLRRRRMAGQHGDGK